MMRDRSQCQVWLQWWETDRSVDERLIAVSGMIAMMRDWSQCWWETDDSVGCDCNDDWWTHCCVGELLCVWESEGRVVDSWIWWQRRDKAAYDVVSATQHCRTNHWTTGQERAWDSENDWRNSETEWWCCSQWRDDCWSLWQLHGYAGSQFTFITVQWKICVLQQITHCISETVQDGHSFCEK